jgi:sugar phosphate permease
LAERAVRQAHVEPQLDLILHTDPVDRSMWWAIRYVLRIRTNVIIIVASALGYFFFTGLRSFAIIYVTGHYGLTKSIASLLVLVVGAGAVIGVFAGGRLADRALARGRLRARVVVPMVCLFLIPLALAPAIATTSVALAIPLLVIGAALLSAPNAPLDAARLDIVHPRLWGRAEAVRTSLRSLADAAAPTTFGIVSGQVFGGPGQTGLEYTFLLGLVPLLVAAVLLLPALRTYPRDVATASASVRATTPAADTPQRRE